MSVNSISSFSGQTQTTTSKLSEATKQKLQALGIDPTSVTSEAQAQTLITAAQSRRQVQKTNNENNSKNTCSSESELISRAKSLAAQMGVSVSSTESLSDILSKLTSRISAMSGQKNANVKDLQKFQAEISSIQSEYSTVQSNEDSMYTALNYTANMNKFTLGLN